MSLKKYVSVELGGKEKLLRFDYNSVSDLEQYYGKGIAAILTEEQFGFNTARVFYCFGLRWKDPAITIQRVGMLLGEEIDNGSTLDKLLAPVMEALKLSKLLGTGNETQEDEEEAKFEQAKN